MALVNGNWKQWADETFRGLENVTMPSFTPDLKALDEEGIRHDVRMGIREGFFSTLCPEVPVLSRDERRRFMEIVCDEAQGQINVAVMLLGETLAETIALAEDAERAGIGHATLCWPASFRSTDEDALYAFGKAVCEATSLPIVLYASERFDFGRIHPSAVPFGLYDRLADIPNVVAMKVGFPEPGVVFECFERYAGKLQVNIGTIGILGLFPLLLKRYRVQWGGSGLWEMWQSPEKPYMVEFFDLVLRGRVDEAMKVYWHIAPANAAGAAQLGGKHRVGGTDSGALNALLGKYVTWSVGGNGGLIRQPAQRITADQVRQRKATLRSIGIEPREPDEEFYVGRVNYARGVRPSDIAGVAPSTQVG